MAAWISAEPDVKNESDTYRRVMICQDHDEIYIIFATYGWKYVEYIRDEIDPDDGRSFLTMHEFGPFHPSYKGNIERLGSVIVALTQQLEKLAKEGQPCRW
ncbi:hypothetical protein EMCG_02412 [[Emmonsia] crescens]|uniref:Uncharacterized protein n=1 Tax=[Emmonsia] crescens TaxID=73230 RepID=A0A0G2HY20_9EURO|nr:hypothetical protein EMCG_02412 [Emmonsia crescens UAMH 3008]